MSIYLKGGNTAKNIEELIGLGFSDYNRAYFTKTYNDKDLSYVQCDSGRRRSFSDLLEICQTYFPDTTEAKLAKLLLNGKFRSFFCNDIKKIVFRNGGKISFKTYNASFNSSDFVGIDGYSFDMIEELSKQ